MDFRTALLHEDGIEGFGFICISPTLIHEYEKNGVILSYYGKNLIEIEKDGEEQFTEKAYSPEDLCYGLTDDDIELIKGWFREET